MAKPPYTGGEMGGLYLICWRRNYPQDRGTRPNDFILIGKGSELAAHRQEDQEVMMLALHLLQNAMVYINTLMIQRVLSEKAWMGRMTAEDFRALMPLLYGHLSPYGTFVLVLCRNSLPALP